MSAELVNRSDRDGVVVLTLNRPDHRNALSQALITELSAHLSRVGVDHGVRAVVLTGAGEAFCAGMDLREAFAPITSAEEERRAIAEVNALGDLLDQVHHLPQPTVAAINGPALAGGAGLAMACDLAIMKRSARIGYPEVHRGLTPAMVAHDLIRLVGQRRARALLLTGQPCSSADALAWGLVNEVVEDGELLDRALAVGRSLRAGAPGTQTTIKGLLDEASGRPRTLRQAAAVTAQARVADEAREGIAAFLEKRPPRWA